MVLQYVDLFIYLFFGSSFFQNSRTSFFISYTWKESFKWLQPYSSINEHVLFWMQSGELYFYNTRTQKRTLSDPRSTINPEPLNPSPMSLDLELNLPCGSLEKKNDIQEQHNSFMMKQNSSGDNTEPGSGLTRSPSWLTCEGEQQEMVTAVCEKCYMLVMMYKSSPACPNCKFMHPPDTSPKLFNPRLSLLC